MPKNTNSKSKGNGEAQLLELLKKVLPKVAPDPALAEKIYSGVEAELRSNNRVASFEKFCSRLPVPDLEPATLEEVQLQLASSFGDGDVTIKPDKKENSLAVEVSLKDGTQLQAKIPVRPTPPEENEEPEIQLKFIAFPVSLPGDPELVWTLARRENLSADEAGIALTKAEDDFWGSKTGQKLLRDRVERSFPEFISRAPAGLLGDVGLKRHYKLPEPIKVLRVTAAKKKV